MNSQHQSSLVDVFVQRRFESADVGQQDLTDRMRLAPCLDLHGVEPHGSYQARNGRRVLCHFRAPDAESLRIALRVAGVDYDALWAGAISHLPGPASLTLVVEKAFERPLDEKQERAWRAATARQLLDLGAEPARVLLSRCRKRVLWLCRIETKAAIETAESELAARGFEAWGCHPGHMEATK